MNPQHQLLLDLIDIGLYTFDILNYQLTVLEVSKVSDIVAGSLGSSPLTRTRKRLRIGYNSESFSTKSTLSGGINRIHDEIPLASDEIRLDGGGVDLISSEAVG